MENNIDKFYEVLMIFKTVHPKMELPQMIYSTIICNKLKNSDIYNMDTECFIECMNNAILFERDETVTMQFEKEFTKTEEHERRDFDKEI